MLIFNTTFLVSDAVLNQWIEWIQQNHVPFMLKSGYFTKPQVAKVLTTNEEQEGTSFSVQFHVVDMDTLHLWNKQYGSTFQQNFSQQFGQEAMFFTTILELVD